MSTCYHLSPTTLDNSQFSRIYLDFAQSLKEFLGLRLMCLDHQATLK